MKRIIQFFSVILALSMLFSVICLADAVSASKKKETYPKGAFYTYIQQELRGSVKAPVVQPTYISDGKYTVYYAGTIYTKYAKTTALPQKCGIYSIYVSIPESAEYKAGYFKVGTFKIVPNNDVGGSFNLVGKCYVAKWKKQPDVDGYRIECSRWSHLKQKTVVKYVKSTVTKFKFSNSHFWVVTGCEVVPYKNITYKVKGKIRTKKLYYN